MSAGPKAVFGSGLIAALIATLPLIGRLAPAAHTVKEYSDAVELYAKYLRRPVAELLSFGSAPYVADVLFFWIALFAAINISIYRDDGLYVWGHIERNSCFNAKGSARCVAPKFLLAVLLTPAVCIAALFTLLRTGRSYLTMAYITVSAREVGKILLALFAVPIIVISLLSLLPMIGAVWKNN